MEAVGLPSEGGGAMHWSAGIKEDSEVNGRSQDCPHRAMRAPLKKLALKIKIKPKFN